MYNHPPVNGMLYLELQIVPNGGNTLSTSIVFSPNLLPYTALTDGDYSMFYPEFNLGDIYRGTVEVISYIDFSEPLPEYCTVTILEKKLTNSILC